MKAGSVPDTVEHEEPGTSQGHARLVSSSTYTYKNLYAASPPFPASPLIMFSSKVHCQCIICFYVFGTDITYLLMYIQFTLRHDQTNTTVFVVSLVIL
ncbi:hypothetical protein YC2023_112541 [Brassica napus]